MLTFCRGRMSIQQQQHIWLLKLQRVPRHYHLRCGLNYTEIQVEI